MSYDFLIEMGWKSAAIAGGALLLAAMLSSRAAADRGAVLKVAVALLLALPAIALFAPALEIETPAPAPAAALAAAPAAPARDRAGGRRAGSAAAPPPLRAAAIGTIRACSSSSSMSAESRWSAAGCWRGCGPCGAGPAAPREVESPEWRAALARAGGDSLGIRLLACDEASSPLSWGLRRPVILLDRDTLRTPEEADAILAHEVAHVARRDWPSLILSRLAVALFWFNPLVWRLDREVAQQAEEAADSDAAATVEPARYAQTLLDWARLSGASALPANAIAAGEPGLSRRVKAILDGRVARRSGSAWAVAAMLGCAAFAAPVAALDFVPEAPEAPPAPLAPPRGRGAARLGGPGALRPPLRLRGQARRGVRAAGSAGARRGRRLRSLRSRRSPRRRAGPPWRLAPSPAAMLARPCPRPPRPGPYVDEAAIEAQVAAAVAEAMRSVEAATADIGPHVERAVAAALAGSSGRHGGRRQGHGRRRPSGCAPRRRSSKSSRAYRDDVRSAATPPAASG